jgi:hypothetical protein
MEKYDRLIGPPFLIQLSRSSLIAGRPITGRTFPQAGGQLADEIWKSGKGFHFSPLENRDRGEEARRK